MDVWFRHKTTGRLKYDPRKNTKHYEPWWALLLCEEEIPRLYAWFLLRHGVPTEPTNKLWGAHVSVIKGQKPPDEKLWGRKKNHTVEFWYTNQIRWNHTHAWLDVWSPEMSEIRESMGLPPKVFYHLTLGRLK